MTDLVALNMRQTASYQADTIASLQARLRLLETQELGASPSAIETIQDTVGAMLTDSSSIDFTYDDGAATITAIVKDAGVTSAMLRNSSALSVIGRSANSSGVPADIAATASTGYVLRESAGVLGFGQIVTNAISDATISNTKLASMVQATVKGRAVAAGTGAPTDLTASQLNAIWGSADSFNASNIVTLGVGSDEGQGQMGTPRLKIKGNTMLIYRESADSQPPSIEFLKRRSGTGTALQSGDIIGRFAFTGADTNTFGATGAFIDAVVDGTPGSSDMPTRLMFYTSPDGSATPDEAFRIDSSQNLIVDNGNRIETEEIRARDSDGLLLRDDGANYGIFIEDGGEVGIGTGTPFARLHVVAPSGDGIVAIFDGDRSANNVATQFRHYGAANTANSANMAFILSTSTTTRTAFNFACGFSNITDANRTSSVGFNTANNGTFGEAMHLEGNRVGIGTAAPQGRLHIYNGTGGAMFTTKTSIDGTAQTILSSSTITKGAMVMYVCVPSSGTAQTGTMTYNGLSVDQTIFSSGSDICKLRVGAGGAMDVRRTGGSLTYTVAVWIVWV